MQTGITEIDGNKYGVLILLPEELRALKLRITLGDWRDGQQALRSIPTTLNFEDGHVHPLALYGRVLICEPEAYTEESIHLDIADLVRLLEDDPSN